MGTEDKPDPTGSALGWAWHKGRIRRSTLGFSTVTATALVLLIEYAKFPPQPKHPTRREDLYHHLGALGIAVAAVALLAFLVSLAFALREQRDALKQRLAENALPIAGGDDDPPPQARVRNITLSGNLIWGLEGNLVNLPPDAEGVSITGNDIVGMTGDVMHVRDDASPDDLTGDVIEDREVRLTDVPRTDGTVLRGKTFRRCVIVGPAIVAPLEGSAITGCHLSYQPATVEAILWPWPDSELVLGCIALIGTAFIECTLVGIGITGVKDVLDQFRNDLGRGQSPPELPVPPA